MSSTELEENLDSELKRPSKYQVVLLNDNYTAVDFVIEVLRMIFNKSTEDAVRITEKIHNDGSGVVGIYSYEIAKTKLMLLDEASKKNNFPLKGVMEKIDD